MCLKELHSIMGKSPPRSLWIRGNPLGRLLELISSCRRGERPIRGEASSEAEVVIEISQDEISSQESFPQLPEGRASLFWVAHKATEDAIVQLWEGSRKLETPLLTSYSKPWAKLMTGCKGGSKYSLGLRSLQTLRWGEWLDDEVMNCFMCDLLSNRPQTARKSYFVPRIVFMNSFFFERAKSRVDGIVRWLTKAQLLTNDFLMFPIHLESHWVLGILRLPRRGTSGWVSVIDSLQDPNEEGAIAFMKKFRAIMERFLDCCKGQHKELDADWIGRVRLKYKYIHGTPKQLNDVDCGVLVLMISEFLSRPRKADQLGKCASLYMENRSRNIKIPVDYSLEDVATARVIITALIQRRCT